MADFEAEMAAFQAEMSTMVPDEEAAAAPSPPSQIVPGTASALSSSAAAEVTAIVGGGPPGPPPGAPRMVGFVSAKPVLHSAAVDKKDKKKRKRDDSKVPTAALPPGMEAPSAEAAEEELALQMAEASRPLEADVTALRAAPPAPPAPAAVPAKKDPAAKPKVHLRKAAGKIWADHSLADWADGDIRIFCGDLGNEVNDNTLAKVFVNYKSFAKARVIRDKRTQKTKGYGFVSFLDPLDAAEALREMQGAYVGNRPIKLRKSNHNKRDYVAKNKTKKNKNHMF